MQHLNHTGVWRQKLPSTEAGGPYTIVFENEGSENITLDDVMFGDVYLCGGQSNMQFSLGGNENATFFANEANNYPNMRLFTVGQGTESPGVPLNDLKTIEQVWTRTSSTTVTDGSAFNYFSAVCYFFGKTVSDSMNRTVPIGLISNNWGGTKVEQWLEPASTQLCGHNSTGELYNAMIAPYTVGPMALKGFTWYQGEADYVEPNNLNYSCTERVLIENWRSKFQSPNAFFGIVQLSTWIVPDPVLLAELREQQLTSLSHLQNVAYATNADRGYGSNIHPPFKEYPGTRLGNAVRSIVYDDARVSDWRSPSYESSKVLSSTDVVVNLKDVPETLEIYDIPPNSLFASPEACAALNQKTPRTCAYAEVTFDNGISVNASVVSVSGSTMTIRASCVPQGAKNAGRVFQTYNMVKSHLERGVRRSSGTSSNVYLQHRIFKTLHPHHRPHWWMP